MLPTWLLIEQKYTGTIRKHVFRFNT